MDAWAVVVAGVAGSFLGFLGSLGGVWLKGHYDVAAEQRQAERAKGVAESERCRQAYARFVVVSRTLLRVHRQLKLACARNLVGGDDPLITERHHHASELIEAWLKPRQILTSSVLNLSELPRRKFKMPRGKRVSCLEGVPAWLRKLHRTASLLGCLPSALEDFHRLMKLQLRQVQKRKRWRLLPLLSRRAEILGRASRSCSKSLADSSNPAPCEIPILTRQTLRIYSRNSAPLNPDSR